MKAGGSLGTLFHSNSIPFHCSAKVPKCPSAQTNEVGIRLSASCRFASAQRNGTRYDALTRFTAFPLRDLSMVLAWSREISFKRAQPCSYSLMLLWTAASCTQLPPLLKYVPLNLMRRVVISVYFTLTQCAIIILLKAL